MIYTVTLNPAIDYNVNLSEPLKEGMNRTHDETIHFSGKGVNVSLVLTRLQVENVATGFIAGFTGKAIKNGLALEGVKTNFFEVDGFTRINVKIKGEKETEINGSGPFVDEQSLKDLIDYLKSANKDDVVVLSGSLPKGLASDTYKRIISELNPLGIKTVLDSSGEALKLAISSSPFLIKPNLAELSYLLGKKLTVEKEVIEGARMLQKFGAQNILVSMGSLGAVLVLKDGTVLREEAVEGYVVNTVGAGDSLLAGFLAAMQNYSVREALKKGVKIGTATAFSDGIASKTMLEKIFNDK